ncbi:hypothetical protein [Zavarzinella formosa]|uniref:hypothetical protein n=1 Tax=Zavarzinella formosa TaxID=360055 RepID=UPI000306B6CC|nr:hypothetical protein [Zavarzinella formosa]
MAAGNHLISLASSTLGVPANAADADRRTSFLWRLDETDYMPTADVLESAGVLGILSRDGEVCPVLQARFERDFHEQVGQFVGDYWELDQDDRRAEWNRLNQLSESLPKYRARLHDLSAGLGLEWPEDLEERLQTVVHCVEQVFVLPRAMRADRLEELCREEGLQPAELRLMAHKLLGVCPAAERVFHVLGLSKASKAKPVPVASGDVERRKPKPQKTLVASGSPQKKAGTPGIIFLVVLGLVGGFLRAGCGPSNSPSSISPITYPQFSPPTMPKWNVPKWEPPEWAMPKHPGLEPPKIKPFEPPKIDTREPFPKTSPFFPPPGRNIDNQKRENK